MRLLLKDFRKKTRSTNRERAAITARRRNEKTSRKDRIEIKKSRRSRKKNDIKKSRKENDIRENQKKTKSEKVEEKTTSDDSEIENLTRSKAEFRLLLLTEKWRNTNIETLKWLTRIVTVLTKSYFSTNDIAEIIDELNKAKRRILTQVSETFTKLSKYRKVLFLKKDFHSHDRKDSESNYFDFFFRKFNENFWKRRKESRKNFVLNESFKTIKETFLLFFIFSERKKK